VKPDPSLVGHFGLAVDHPALHLCGAAYRVDDAGEFRQHAVAGGLDDPALVFPDLRIDQFTQMRLERSCVPSSSARTRRIDTLSAGIGSPARHRRDEQRDPPAQRSSDRHPKGWPASNRNGRD
jgi:hypothetical protein